MLGFVKGFLFSFLVEALTHAEALVFEALLGADSTKSERSRRNWAGLPRSTYQEAKRRLYGEGWLEDRFIPEPRLAGASLVGFHLSQPVAEARESLARRVAEDPTTVLLWMGVHSLFSIRLVTAGSVPSDPCGESDAYTFCLRVPPDHVRVYFDFEGAWSTMPGLVPPSSYPRSFPGVRGGPRGRATSKAHLLELRELVSRPFREVTEGTSPLKAGAFFLPRSQRLLLSNNDVAWRVLPKLDRELAVGSSTIRQLVLLTGSRRPDAALDRLLPTLVEECMAHPFLLADDGNRALVGLLAKGLPLELAGTLTTARPSVLGTLQRFLGQIRIFREDLGTLKVLLDHRYDRLFAK